MYRPDCKNVYLWLEMLFLANSVRLIVQSYISKSAYRRRKVCAAMFETAIRKLMRLTLQFNTSSIMLSYYQTKLEKNVVIFFFTYWNEKRRWWFYSFQISLVQIVVQQNRHQCVLCNIIFDVHTSMYLLFYKMLLLSIQYIPRWQYINANVINTYVVRNYQPVLCLSEWN